MTGVSKRRRAAVAAAAALALAGCATTTPKTVDLLIAGGTVIDGTGAPARRADVGVRGDRIVFVGDARRKRVVAARTVDASGLIVAPGFIDPHTHSGSDLRSDDPKERAALNHLTQGVTTVFIGNDGDGSPAVADTLSQAEAGGIGVNVASFVGFGAVRRQVVGDADRAPTADELQRMKRLVADGMCQGALGFSAGLYYAPQSYAKTDEVVALAREAAARGGLYETHLRSEGTDNVGLIAAVEEALTVGREARLPVHFAHIKAQGHEMHGRSGEVIARIEAERAAGRRVTADQYPWSASGTRVSNALVPRWAMDGGEAALKARLADPALRERLRADMAANLHRRGGAGSLLITSGPHAGKRLEAVASGWNVDPLEAAIRIVRDEGDARVASFNMSEADIRDFAGREWVVSSSDATAGHPRKYGSFPLRWRKFVRETPVMTPEQFVRRSSGLTADIFGLTDRGYLRPGAFADVAVFDPERLAARADYENPTRLSEGVVHVLVNGRAAVEDGRPADPAAGRALRKPARADWDCPA